MCAEIIGESRGIRTLRSHIKRFAPTSLPVLIQGPTGAGKDLVAQALHRLSGRRGSLVSINACAVSEGMVEAVLFGHMRGAFTGAVNNARGLLHEADGGTLFLDEIGSIPALLQPKLLRAIETRRFRPVGSVEERHSAFRVVSATNEPLHAMVRGGQFRADLHHRLGGAILVVPALNQRRDDIPLLVQHFLDQEPELEGTVISDRALQLLQGQDWPGNVRELQHVIARARALGDGPAITHRDVRAALAHGDAPIRREYSAEHVNELRAILRAHGWDTASVAKALGVHRATIYRRIQRHGIAPKGGDEGIRET